MVAFADQVEVSRAAFVMICLKAHDRTPIRARPHLKKFPRAHPDGPPIGAHHLGKHGRACEFRGAARRSRWESDNSSRNRQFRSVGAGRFRLGRGGRPAAVRRRNGGALPRGTRLKISPRKESDGGAVALRLIVKRNGPSAGEQLRPSWGCVGFLGTLTRRTNERGRKQFPGTAPTLVWPAKYRSFCVFLYMRNQLLQFAKLT